MNNEQPFSVSEARLYEVPVSEASLDTLAKMYVVAAFQNSKKIGDRISPFPGEKLQALIERCVSAGASKSDIADVVRLVSDAALNRGISIGHKAAAATIEKSADQWAALL